MSAKDSNDPAGHEAQARAIACELGDGWIAHDHTPPPEYQYRSWQLIRQADGLTLSLEWPEAYGAAKLKPARVIVSLVWPLDGERQRTILRAPYGQADYTTTITIDASKHAAQLAKEITRRLIVHVEPLHVRALALIQQRHEAGADQAAAVARILATEPGAHISRNSGPNVIYLGPTSHGYTVRVDSATSVRFEAFSVDDPETAIRVLHALRRTCRDCGFTAGHDRRCPKHADYVEMLELEVEGARLIAQASEANATAATMISALAAVNRQVAQAQHEAEDPHCTCNDCILSHAARLEAGS